MWDILADLADTFKPGEVGELEIEWNEFGVRVNFYGPLSFTAHYIYHQGKWVDDTAEDLCLMGSDAWMREVGIL